MAKMQWDVSKCQECPCLRNTEYGYFTCFYNDNIQIEYYDVDVISYRCPCVVQSEEENKNV